MLHVRQTRVTVDGATFIRTTFADACHTAWPYIEIEPEDDSLPVLITRIGVRTFRIECWTARAGHLAECWKYDVRSEERALKIAANRVRKLNEAA